MALYKNESKDRVRDAVDFLELVSARTELRRSGPARYQGLCPFHDERTPSFGIDPGQKVYYCFGCQASGDVFTFVQETEGVDFKGALELLAERYGVELEREEEDPREAEQRRRRERLLELLSRTTAYYERYLWESSEARRALVTSTVLSRMLSLRPGNRVWISPTTSGRNAATFISWPPSAAIAAQRTIASSGTANGMILTVATIWRGSTIA